MWFSVGHVGVPTVGHVGVVLSRACRCGSQ